MIILILDNVGSNLGVSYWTWGKFCLPTMLQFTRFYEREPGGTWYTIFKRKFNMAKCFSM